MNRYSARLPWATPPNQYSLLLERRRLAGGALLDLSVSNPTEALDDYPHADIARAFAGITDFGYQPAPLGLACARRAIAGWYGAREIPISETRLALTASTSEAYSLLFKLLCDPGDDVLVPAPSYPLFEFLARAEGVRALPYRLEYDGAWFLDLASIGERVTARTKALIVVNPNNPTGSYLKAGELDALEALAAAHGFALISDEVFMTYPAAAGAERVATLIGRENVLSFSLNGLSKAAAMPQMKLGWIAVNGPAGEAAGALAKLELLLDNYLSAGTPVQRALPALLGIGAGLERRIQARLGVNRQALAGLGGTAVEPLGSEGGWSAILRLPNVRSEEEWIRALLGEPLGVVVQPGYFYDMPGEAYLVVSLLAEPARFAAGLDKISRYVSEVQ